MNNLIPKFYTLEDMTQDDLNKLALERNSFAKEIDRLNNIIKPKEVNYNYLKLLFEKKDKEEVIKSYVYKCEQLEKLYKSYEEKEIEVMKKDNIINIIKNNIDITIQIIKEQPTGNDAWILERLDGIRNIGELEKRYEKQDK